MKMLTTYNTVCSTALIDAGEQVLYLKLNQYDKIVSIFFYKLRDVHPASHTVLSARPPPGSTPVGTVPPALSAAADISNSPGSNAGEAEKKETEEANIHSNQGLMHQTRTKKSLMLFRPEPFPAGG